MKQAIIYSYATLDSRNSGWYKVGLTTIDADTRISQQDTTSNYQKPEKMVEFDFTELCNARGISVDTIEKEFHDFLQYVKRCVVRKDKKREWFVTDGLGPIYEARDYIMKKYDVKPTSIILKSPSGKYKWQWDLVLLPLLKHFKSGYNKAQSIIFCAGGKTIIAYWVSRLIRPLLKDKINLTVVCVPSLYLIKQTYDEYQQQQKARNEVLDVMCVCSDKRIANTTEADLSIDDLPCVSTDVKVIRKWVNKDFNDKGMRVIFTTYQSGKKLAKALKGIDSEKAFSHLILDKNFKAQFKWFLTATPKEYNRGLDA